MWIIISKERLEKLESKVRQIESVVVCLQERTEYQVYSEDPRPYFINPDFNYGKTTTIKEVVGLIMTHLGLTLGYEPEQHVREKFILQNKEDEKQKRNDQSSHLS